MKNYFLLSALMGILLVSCTQNTGKTLMDERIVTIANEGSGKELMEQLFSITKDGNRHCYKDTTLQTAFTRSIFEDESHVIKEVIQLPDAQFPSEFLDSLIVTKAQHNSFSRMLVYGKFQEGKLVEITRAQLLFKLIVDGHDPGELPTVNVDPKALNKETSFLQRANKTIQSESLGLLTRHAWEKHKNAGKVDDTL